MTDSSFVRAEKGDSPKELFKITHLYPRHMSLYGDRGNARVMAFIAEQLGVQAQIFNCEPGEVIPSDSKVILLGGGQDHDQEHIVKNLLSRRNEIQELIYDGAVLLGVCGGYQLLGEYYESAVGNYLDGLKLINIHTQKAKPQEKRIIGNVIAESEKFGTLIGFENHGGRTYLGDGVEALAKITQGGGNNGKDKTEGIFQEYGKGLLIGTYLHSFLPKNPQVAELIIQKLCSELKEKKLTDKLFENLNKKTCLNLNY